MGAQPKFVIGLLLLLALAGCSGLKDYPGGSERNLLIRTQASGTTLTKVTAFLHVYRMQDVCNAEYLGTVTLDRNEMTTGVPLRQPIYLKFVFKTSQRFSNNSAIIPYGVMVTSQPEVRYVAELRYADGMYQVEIREFGPSGGPGRLLERRMPSCPSSGK